MAWYWLGYLTSEPGDDPDLRMPGLLITAHAATKGLQIGLSAGMLAGAVLSFRRGKLLNKELFFHDVTTRMRDYGAVGGLLLGPAYGLSICAKSDAAARQERAKAIAASKWANRVDTFSIYGGALGQFLARPDAMANILGFQGVFIPFGGVAWGVMAGMLFDVPLSILLPNYWAHNEDVDWIFPQLVGLEEE